MIKNLLFSLILTNAILHTNSFYEPNQYFKYSMENSSIITNPWTLGILIHLKISLWAPLFDDITDRSSFKGMLTLCINRGIPPPQPPIFIRLIEYEHLTGLTGIFFEFPKNEETNTFINRNRIFSFLFQCREDKLGGEAHIATHVLSRNVPTVQITKQEKLQPEKIEDYSMATTFTITILMVATTLSVISVYVVYYTVMKNKK
ncbi:hypothetical protein HWI79_1827 [Cryptosporidium felis]|nr:hypothetical protein HWI79_1827 [Cryptosporidium felis]